MPATAADADTPTEAAGDIAHGGFESLIPAFSGALAGVGSLSAARGVITRHGRRLWQRATRRAQRSSADTDDRPLYWARLALTRALREWAPAFAIGAADRAALMDLLERTSRGMDTVNFPGRATQKRILISGFDPFGFDRDDYGRMRASNPSGAAALALDGTTIVNGAHSGRVEAVVFPNRYSAFDAGMVESLFTPFLSGPNAASMIMTIGQASDEYEVEEFAGRARGIVIPDNEGVTPSASAPPPGVGAGPEFLRGTLPAASRSGLGGNRPADFETEVLEIPQGSTDERPSVSGPTPGSTAVEGSGGAFLCNEIFYRVRLAGGQGSVPAGHLHVPSQTPVGASVTESQFASTRDSIIARVRSILTASLPSI